MWPYIQPVFLKLLYLILPFADNDCHIYAFKFGDLFFQIYSFFAFCYCFSLFLKFVNIHLPVLLDFIVHLYRCELIDGYDKSFSGITTCSIMFYNVFCNCFQTVFPYDDVVFLCKLGSKFGLFFIIQTGFFDFFVNIIVEACRFSTELQARDFRNIEERLPRLLLNA